MGNWIGKTLPDIHLIKNSKFQSNCCNKEEYSYINCIHCQGSGKIYIDEQRLPNKILANSKK